MGKFKLHVIYFFVCSSFGVYFWGFNVNFFGDIFGMFLVGSFGAHRRLRGRESVKPPDLERLCPYGGQTS